MASINEIQTLMSEAATALAGGDYFTAELKAISAQGMLVGLPSLASKSGYAGGSQQFRPETVDEFLKNVRMLKASAAATTNAASGGMVIMPLQLRRAGCAHE